MDNGNENEYSVPQIFKQLKEIYERFIQSKGLVEKAKHYLSAQKNVTARQCKHATKSFFELDGSIGKLYDLLRQRPLPEIIDTQRYRINLMLRMLEKCRDDLPDHINALGNRFGRRDGMRGRQDDFITFIQILMKQLDELINMLDTILASAISSGLMDEQDVKETGSQNNKQESGDTLNEPSQLSEPLAPQNSYSRLEFILLLICNILIGIFAPKKTHARPPLGIPKTTQVDASNETPEIVRDDLLPDINVPIVATEVRDEGSFEFLYDILKQYVQPVELAHICRKLKIDHQSLDDKSHETRAYSLTEKMENQNRLEELKQELSERLPKRFPDSYQP